MKGGAKPFALRLEQHTVQAVAGEAPIDVGHPSFGRRYVVGTLTAASRVHELGNQV